MSLLSGGLLGKLPHPFGILGAGRNILPLCDQLEAGNIDVKTFVTEITAITNPNKQLGATDLAYWSDRWTNKATDPELSTNLFLDSNVPIVGLNGSDSTPARTLALLIIRAYLSVSSGAT